MARNLVAASSHVIELGTTSPVNTAPFTMFARFRVSSSQNADIFSITSGDSTTPLVRYQLRIRASPARPRVSAYRGTFATITGGSNYSTNVWNSIALTVTSSTSREGFLNGTSFGADTTTNEGSNSDTIDLISVSRDSGGLAAVLTYTGDVADLAIWNVVLTAAEIASLHKFAPLFIRPDSLQFYAPMTGMHTTEPDYIGGLNLTVTGATKTDHPPVIFPIKGRAPYYTRTSTGFRRNIFRSRIIRAVY